jgi:hypothetical protein
MDLEEPSCVAEPQHVTWTETFVPGEVGEPEVLRTPWKVSPAKRSGSGVLPAEDERPFWLYAIEGFSRAAPAGASTRKWK